MWRERRESGCRSFTDGSRGERGRQSHLEVGRKGQVGMQGLRDRKRIGRFKGFSGRMYVTRQRQR